MVTGTGYVDVSTSEDGWGNKVFQWCIKTDGISNH